jgi:hypothetical protein
MSFQQESSHEFGSGFIFFFPIGTLFFSFVDDPMVAWQQRLPTTASPQYMYLGISQGP